ncbi:MAG: hypothetical protein WCQ95_10470 [Bacteroidota bacterium]
MKKLYFLLVSLMITLSGFSQSNVGINPTGLAPNADAGLDVDFSNKGILIPRVSLQSSSSFAPLSAHVAGMIVYNTATIADVKPGFYYDNGTKWIPGFLTGNSLGDMLYWNGTQWLTIPIGLPGQFLQVTGSNIPSWGGATFSTIITTAATAITGTTATSGGTISSDGGSPVLTRGICWNTSTGPTIANSKTTDGAGIGTFTSNLTGLVPLTTYYVRAYTINSNVVSYGNEISFTTTGVLPTLAATTAATVLTGVSATSGGNVTSDGGAPIIERGICYGTTSNPSIIANTKIIDPSPGTGLFVSNIAGLTGNMTYYVRAYATNAIGTAYGTQITFTTLVNLPVIITTAPSSVGSTTATSGGTATMNGTGRSFGNYGIAYSTVSNSPTPTFVSNGFAGAVMPTSWVTNLTGLAGNTTYYLRAYLEVYDPTVVWGQPAWSTLFGNEYTITTNGAGLPVITSTKPITGKSANTANTGGNIASDGGAAISAKGVCWSTSATPTLGVLNFTNDGTGNTSYNSQITGLTASTTYYVRAYATNSVGTSYGPVDVVFTTWVQSPYSLGQDVGYGICAYVDSLGSGFVVSYDIPFTGQWGCSGTSIATSSAMGTGLANTDAILAACATRPIAASVAKDYTGGGYLDWYLPSSGEWSQILVGASSNLYYHSTNNFYTSTQQNATYAVSAFFNYNSGYISGESKAGSIYVQYLRAIRSFTAAPAATVPTVTTDAITNITGTTATSGGNVTSDGGMPIIENGVCWSTTSGPTIADSRTIDGAAVGTFISSVTGLTISTTYYVRAYATNGMGTAYGNEVSFTTNAAGIPSVSTLAVLNMIGAIAEGGVNVVSDNGNPLTALGLVWATTTGPTITTNVGMTNDGTLTGTYYPLMTNLSIGTTYYVRAYATNSAGTAYGTEVVFTEAAATIGQYVSGGLIYGNVFSIDGTGLHGLIADPWGFGTSDWGCTGTYAGANGTAIGTGQANTTAIVADITTNACVSASPTAAYAAQISTWLGPDWYLPSKDEFDLLWTNRVAAGVDANLSPAFPFWSSSEVNTSTATPVWYFDGTTWVNTGAKTDLYTVWPIRGF